MSKYSLPLIISLLPKVAEITISMESLVMCAEKFLRLLCPFWGVFYILICACQPLGWLFWYSGTSARSRQPNHPMLHNLDFDLTSTFFFFCFAQCRLAKWF
jgi:hypothetical protein